MVGHPHKANPNVSSGDQCRRTCSNSPSIKRRRYLVVGAALTLVGGCLGGDGEGGGDDQVDATDDDPDGHIDDSTSGDAPTSTDDDDGNEETDHPTDDSSDTSDGEAEMALDVREDFESYILDMEVSHDGPDGEWTQYLYREEDVANDRLYQILEMEGDEGQPGAFEHYIVDGEAYQIFPDDTCIPSDEATIMVHAENPGGFARPHPEDIDANEEHITYKEQSTVAWVDEPVHVWEIDLEPTFEAIDGKMEMYVGVESGYFIGYEGWYTTGAHDDPAEITIDYRLHSFNQDFEIEIPDECTE